MTDAELLRKIADWIAQRGPYLTPSVEDTHIAHALAIADRLEAAESTLALCPLCGNQRAADACVRHEAGCWALLRRLNEEADNAHKDLEAAEAHAARLREALEAQPMCAGQDDLSLRAALKRQEALAATPKEAAMDEFPKQCGHGAYECAACACLYAGLAADPINLCLRCRTACGPRAPGEWRAWADAHRREMDALP